MDRAPSSEEGAAESFRGFVLEKALLFKAPELGTRFFLLYVERNLIDLQKIQ